MTFEDNAKEMILKGAGMVGEAGGGAIVGFLFGGPLGAAAGAIAPLLVTPIKEIIVDIANRYMSPREKIKVGMAAFYACSKIREHIENADKLRNDDFFEKKEMGRSDAEEIFEGILLKCKSEHEEKKTKFLSNIFANAAFSNISFAAANIVLGVAERLTYRQICLISLIARQENFFVDTIQLRKVNLLQPDKLTTERHFLFHELCILGTTTHALIYYENEDKNTVVLDKRPEFEGSVKLTGIGATCYELMNLDEVPSKDIAELIEQFNLRDGKT